MSDAGKHAKIRILCVDDHRLVREGIALIIGRQPDMEVVSSAATGPEAVQMFQHHRPDITLMDLRLGRTSGVDAIRQVRQHDPTARLIVLTMYQGDEDVYRALEAGAVTYLLKDMLSDDLIRVIREVNDGLTPSASPEVIARLAERALRPNLTPREVQVLELLSSGMRNREIAAALGISEETVQVHIKRVLAKLQAQDRTAAVNIGVRRGIIHLE